jgi:hypothetical protein
MQSKTSKYFSSQCARLLQVSEESEKLVLDETEEKCSSKDTSLFIDMFCILHASYTFAIYCRHIFFGRLENN